MLWTINCVAYQSPRNVSHALIFYHIIVWGSITAHTQTGQNIYRHLQWWQPYFLCPIPTPHNYCVWLPKLLINLITLLVHIFPITNSERTELSKGSFLHVPYHGHWTCHRIPIIDMGMVMEQRWGGMEKYSLITQGNYNQTRRRKRKAIN